MRYLRIKNFERFQHYKGKFEESAPTWIKLYRSLLTDYEFQKLGDAAKGHLMLIWLFASQTKGRIPDDPKWIAEKIGAASKVDLASLVDAGFLTLESNPKTTLECFSTNGKKDSIREEIRGEERREEYRPTDSPLNGEDLSPTPTASPLKPEDLQEAWNEHVASLGLSRVAELSASRRQKAQRRLHEHPDMDFWATVFGQIRGSAFLKGLAKPRKPDEKPFHASFDWLIDNDNNCVKVYEGRYNG